MLAKEMRFVERFRAQAAKASQVQSRIKKLDKIERIEEPRRLVEKSFDFKRPARAGDDVIKVAQLTKRYGAARVHDNLDLLVRRGERWAVMGGERRRQVDAAQDDRGRARARRWRRDHRRVGDHGLFRAAPDGAARR